MNLDKAALAAAVRAMQQRLGALQRLHHKPEVSPVTLVDEALEELAAGLEELSVVNEELAAQQTSLAQVELRAAALERRQSELVRGMPGLHILTSARGVIEEASRAALERFGTHVDRGRPLPLLVVAEQRADFQAWLRSTPGERAERPGVRFWTERREQELPCDVSVTALSDDAILFTLRPVEEAIEALSGLLDRLALDLGTGALVNRPGLIESLRSRTQELAGVLAAAEEHGGSKSPGSQ